jgi:hypothetical protein
MAQEFLHRPDVIVRFQQVRRKRMAKGVDYGYHVVVIIPWVEKAGTKLFNITVAGMERSQHNNKKFQ